MNGSHEHWSKRARWARQWRERAGMCLLASRASRPWPWPASAPKRVSFVARTWNTWDDDGLRAGLKPVRDALKDAGLISGDAPGDGHVFEYAQQIERRLRGVHITVTAL